MKFCIQHALECKKGGLIHARHDEIVWELIDLLIKAFSKSKIADEPPIHKVPTGNAKDADEDEADTPDDTVKRAKKNDGERGDILIRGFWQRQTDCIVDVRVSSVDTKTYRGMKPAKALELQEKEKKDKYAQSCIDQRRTFTPFVLSTDGLLGVEAKSFLKRLSFALAEKWNRPYSVVRGFVNTRISFAAVRATSLCIRGSRTPLIRGARQVQWQDQTGLSLNPGSY